MLDTQMPLSSLCDERVFKGNRAAYLFWYPFGLVLAVVRSIAIFFIFISALPFSVKIRKRFHFKVLQKIINLSVDCNSSFVQISEKTEGHVVACNHISLFDIFAVLGLPYATILVGHVSFKSVNVISLVGNYMIFICSGASFWPVTHRKDFARKLSQWRKSPRETTLYTTPEKTINNGRGLFHFDPAFVCYKMPVVPLAARIILPFGLNPHPVHSAGAFIFLRMLMMPYINFRLDFLPAIEQELNESKVEFATRVQRLIAAHLDIPATRWNVEDKHLWRRVRQAEMRAHK